uniref:Uncharacterized protein n=1 Tax=Cacopsylla melanoneura TaxID=428564 RepID=A0A8D8LN63_9HEMI
MSQKSFPVPPNSEWLESFQFCLFPRTGKAHGLMANLLMVLESRFDPPDVAFLFMNPHFYFSYLINTSTYPLARFCRFLGPIMAVFGGVHESRKDKFIRV